jgi:hypothetical protein
MAGRAAGRPGRPRIPGRRGGGDRGLGGRGARDVALPLKPRSHGRPIYSEAGWVSRLAGSMLRLRGGGLGAWRRPLEEFRHVEPAPLRSPSARVPASADRRERPDADEAEVGVAERRAEGRAAADAARGSRGAAAAGAAASAGAAAAHCGRAHHRRRRCGPLRPASRPRRRPTRSCCSRARAARRPRPGRRAAWRWRGAATRPPRCTCRTRSTWPRAWGIRT